MNKRVVITGIGLISPSGNSKAENWENLVDGKSLITQMESLGDYQCKAVGLVKNHQDLLDRLISRKEQRVTDKFIHYGLLAASEAISDAGITNNFPVERDRFSVFMGVGIGGIKSVLDEAIVLNERGMKRVSPFTIPRSISNEAAAWICKKWNFQGPMTTIVNACSSSGDAIGNAFRSIRDGYSDFALAGGTESSINKLSIAAFGNMRALSTWSGDPREASRPFDKDRTGFVMGEGAGVLILETLESAKKRGAEIYAEILGYGASSDAYHVTAIHPEGRGAKQAINMALNDGKIDKSKIDYVNAHGTATIMNDVAETEVLKNVFGSAIDPKNENHILVSSTKSMTGHLLGAAGGLETAFSALALKNQIIPPTINLHNPDEKCDLDYVPNVARRANIDFAISNSFGFGGGNSVLLLKRFLN